MSSVLDSAVMILGENRYQSLLEVKGLTIFPFPLRLSKQFEITSLFSQILKNHFFSSYSFQRLFSYTYHPFFSIFFRLIHVCLSNDEVESQWMAVLEAETVFKNFMYILENSLNGESNYELLEGDWLTKTMQRHLYYIKPFLEDTLGMSKKLHVSVSWSLERLWFKLILKSL